MDQMSMQKVMEIQNQKEKLEKENQDLRMEAFKLKKQISELEEEKKKLNMVIETLRASK